MKPYLFLSFFIFIFSASLAQKNIDQLKALQNVPKSYSAHKIKEKITIDGLANESVWEMASWTDDFQDIEGNSKPKPLYSTRMKMLWDDENLYIYAHMIEPHIWGNLTQRDAIIYHNNDFEIFIKPYEHHSTYYEIEVNTLNTIMDLVIPKPYRFGGQPLMHWDVKNMQSAVHISGTNNNPKDIDEYWSVEMAIPFTSIAKFGYKPTPKSGDFWRVNFSRVQWQHEIVNNEYVRKKHNNKFISEDNWVWSPIGIVDMHLPERWGFLKFIDSVDTEQHIPKSYTIEKATWNLFYQQQLNFKNNSEYEADIQKFEFIDFPVQITIDSEKTFFRAKLKDIKNKISTTIDHLGNYTITYE